MTARHIGYARKLVMDEMRIPPGLLEKYGDKVLVVWRGSPLEGKEPAATLGSLTLYVLERHEVPDADNASLVSAEPVLCARRGRQSQLLARAGVDVRVGIDDEVCTSDFLLQQQGKLKAMGAPRDLLLEETKVPPKPPPAVLQHEPELFVSALELIGLSQVRALQKGMPGKVRVAILDESFAGIPPDQGYPAPDFHGLERPPPPRITLSPAMEHHGTRMAVALQEALGEGVELGLYRMVPHEADVHSSWIAPADVALTLAHAIQDWKADVVLIPMGDGLWGTPRYLHAVLREARRVGRDGKGVPIICATGDTSWNHDQGDAMSHVGPMSYAMGADELHAQPWVMAVTATDTAGRWYRRFDGTWTGPIGRFGPSVTLSAPGELYRLGMLQERLADDTSIASALVAGVAAVVLRQAPWLDADEVRALLQWTADLPPVVDGGPGPASEGFNEWDRLGHNLKLGAGRVNALAAALAATDPVCAALLLTRPRPGPIPTRGVAESDPAMLRALAWLGWTEEKHADFPTPWQVVLDAYLQVRGSLARLVLHSWRWREAIMWLARHLMALWTTDGDLLDREGLRDHGALLWRTHYMLDALRAELESPAFQREAKELLPWVSMMETALREVSGGQLQRFLFAFNKGAFELRWMPSFPRGNDLVAPQTHDTPKERLG
ncbi:MULTISPECIES: S8/S53 family peptidase [unclassified Corallococcus]|uniref:S8/S53 family peptidase n=1 Tax=unclassified Corallococcus TaxID=2685029 RepID=UPI001A902192|nr:MULTISPECIES: S8/S53 family peptidase [unclassified Corallococcus]MBN9685732.1 S8/S53 family peptidase [Corallococcus sp. NCSPR001]WAS82823.1 S8/S53 family peptidase [Corallococcus sp. NCRR]